MTIEVKPLAEQGFAPPEARQSGAGTWGLGDMTDLERSSQLKLMREGKMGSIHSWELVTAVDGPGTRMTVFMNGCPLRCLYCHNPDTFQMRDGKPIMIDELLKKIKRYRKIFKSTGGGLTISGGEVLMQRAFAENLLISAKSLGVHTCIDTSGYLGKTVTNEFLDYVDLVLLDIKSGDEETYKKVTGRELQPTIDFGDRLNALGKDVWIRFVAVPGYTDSYKNVEKVADIVCRWPNAVKRVEVLPFHQMGTDKWQSLGLEYKLDDVKPPTKEETERIRDQFRARGLTVY
ncbi:MULTISPECIES: pyruvate formate-lyase-activating protein [unclassified Rothia (in: high G+C Gram-positive bacteria)]|uniref:pyruvate formate-lyase-activating protein n=1 Tax=unclassified Rothia (in: high G+C Gram-positive bacteria) TaxID=2689056 RepID=UPI001959C143|nr:MULTISPECIES: pyruvate formate-lyase-activating protein [unclassified Rothia (in: high G+C Gram-positive bacteria)]MBM7051323.1 pyruvate formate lyase-activating protein [Rothia sp. ZJ1223]QRZ61114.1 pyruvate formate lyase-activating protein [Rothia sp. ZJ932]